MEAESLFLLCGDFDREFDFGDGADAVWREGLWGEDELEFLAVDDLAFAVEVVGRPFHAVGVVVVVDWSRWAAFFCGGWSDWTGLFYGVGSS